MSIEEKVITYLAAYGISGIEGRVYGETPHNISEDYVLVEKTGGGLQDFIHSATIAVKSHGGSLARASEINEGVKTAMLSMPGTEDVYSVSLVSDYNYTNTATKQPRYQAVFTIHF